MLLNVKYIYAFKKDFCKSQYDLDPQPTNFI